MNTNYCGSFPHVDHSDCPSSTECCTGSPSPTQLATACRTAMAALPGHPDRCSCGACAARPVPAERYLTQLEAQVRIARQALADEHEGNFTRAVQLIAQDAEELLAIVSMW